MSTIWQEPGSGMDEGPSEMVVSVAAAEPKLLRQML
jgi:hypothetical protein